MNIRYRQQICLKAKVSANKSSTEFFSNPGISGLKMPIPPLSDSKMDIFTYLFFSNKALFSFRSQYCFDLSCTSASNTNCVDTILEQVIVIEYYSKCGYFVRTVREWNSLSEACVNADTVTAFQTQLCHTP